ncbi:hypothetical protein [Micromonospora sp. NPDC005173]|uniref:hypothetical protein n=1 Tax=Micromonospora sp. NPDC005173 TaxID=3157165 RepID=UPI0033B8A477
MKPHSLLLFPLATLMPGLAAIASLILVIVLMVAAEELAIRRQDGDAVRDSATIRSEDRTDQGPEPAPET